MRPTLLLFDIDGTLLTCGGAGQAAMRRTFDALYGAPDACQFSYAGRTDLGIIAEALIRAGQPADPQTVRRTAHSYLGALREALPEAAGFSVLPGVRALLAALPPTPTRAVGIGTGNWREGAALKLAHADLSAHFSFGGYGSDAHDRAALLWVGAARGAEQLGVPVDACRVVVIGDTPLDVSAAQAIGADCLAVSTGPYPAERLQGATLCVPELTDPRAADWLAG